MIQAQVSLLFINPTGCTRHTCSWYFILFSGFGTAATTTSGFGGQSTFGQPAGSLFGTAPAAAPAFGTTGESPFQLNKPPTSKKKRWFDFQWTLILSIFYILLKLNNKFLFIEGTRDNRANEQKKCRKRHEYFTQRKQSNKEKVKSYRYNYYGYLVMFFLHFWYCIL